MAAVHDRGALHQHCTTKHARKQSMILVARALRGIPPDVRFIAILGERGNPKMADATGVALREARTILP